jgi:hypothetical protein
MNEFSTWMQSNWYSLGTLLLQAGFLSAGVWIVRDVLKSMRASQEQIGALLKLSLTGSLPERHSATAAAESFFANASPYWLTPSEIPPAPAPAPEPIEIGPSRWALARHNLLVWLKTPMHTGHSPTWRKALKWLQAPAGS